ncbi:hypothetical protein FRC05_003543 [Tulasnella sp. 425]|nr:hypothetical protein FRC05_003543 [Tulasnella sp. 425]
MSSILNSIYLDLLMRGRVVKSYSKAVPNEWVEDIHPEGQLLYSKVVSSHDLKIRVHTDLALRDTQNHPIILAAFGRLSQLLESSEELHNAELKDSEVEACILVSDDFPDEFGYYLVNHRDQTAFWLQEVNASDLDMWAYDEDLYRHKLAEQYWRHVTDFPHYCSLSPKVWDQLGALMLLGAVGTHKIWRPDSVDAHNATDQEYSEDSTVPKDAETLARLERLWHQAKEEREADCNKAACNWICGTRCFPITPS